MLTTIGLAYALDRAYANELAFDLDDLTKLHDQTKTVCEDLKKQRDSLKKGLEQLRKDWQTPAGGYFFSKIDDNWESDVTKFINTMSTFQEILGDTIREYTEVKEKMDSINLE